MARGFHLSTEAFISLIFAVIILTAPKAECDYSFRETLILQKQGDLLKIWAKAGKIIPEEAKSDFETCFPDKGGRIEIGDKKIIIEGKKGNEFSTEIYFINVQLKKELWKITVFD